MFSPFSRISSTLAVAVAMLGPTVAGAQDIEMLGRRHGTPLPEGYVRSRAGDASSAFEFRRGWGQRGVDPVFLRARGAAAPVQPRLSIGPRSGPVEGSFLVPVLLGLFSNSGSAPFPATAIEDSYFGAGDGTITHFYDEVSGGRVELLGDVLDWAQAPRPDSIYAADQSGIPFPYPGLGGGGAWNFIWDLLTEVEAGIDWAEYDNDGPDGEPNSGDDDGFVDVLAVIQPTRGGECGGSGASGRIWSHRWALSEPFSGTVFTTSTPAAGGGFIRVDDYTIQPSVACTGGGIAEIGVFAHELGHAFGLPDLYDTDDTNGRHSGAGAWDLMSSGSYGCGNATPEMPCHLGAWSKAALGWVDVVTIAPGTDLGTVTLPPVESSDTVFRVDAQDGSGEYFLIENRQRIGYDIHLPEEGLLIWQIDQGVLDASWPSNQVNAAPHMGVRLRQADGEDDLGAGRGRGDSGDPFPGQTGNSVFHTVSTPSTASYAGGLSGLTMVDIAPTGDDVRFRLSTRFTEMTVRAEGAPAGVQLLQVDGQWVDSMTIVSSAPFTALDVDVVDGVSVSPGVRSPFEQWAGEPGTPRRRTIITPLVDTEYVAEFGGIEYQLEMTLSGGVGGVEPATFASTPSAPDLWFPEGAAVSLTAQPRTGFSFERWTGALAGQSNPALFTMDGPLDAGADFGLLYAVPDVSVELPAATSLDVQLEVEHGTVPAQWRIVEGALPLGVELSPTGRIVGASQDLGLFDVTVEAVDALGLPATGALSLRMVAPQIPIEQLASLFLLSGTPLDAAEIGFLTHQGNETPGYDLGDFRAWVLSNATLPLQADITGAVHRRTIVISAPRPASDR